MLANFVIYEALLGTHAPGYLQYLLLLRSLPLSTEQVYRCLTSVTYLELCYKSDKTVIPA